MTIKKCPAGENLPDGTNRFFFRSLTPRERKTYLTCLLAYFVSSNMLAELFPPKRGLNNSSA